MHRTILTSIVASLVVCACGSSAESGGDGNDAATNVADARDGAIAETSIDDARDDGGTDGATKDAIVGDSDASPALTVPQHFPTAGYAYQYKSFTTADPADVRYYLTFAEMPFSKRATCGNTFADGDCFSLMYMDTDRIYLAAPGSPAGCASMEDGSSYGALPETSFVHVAGATATSANRIRGYYGTRNDAAGDACPIVSYVGNDGDSSSGGIIDHWKSWLTKNDDDALGGFFHDDMGADELKSFLYFGGGGCPPFSGTGGAGTTSCTSSLEFTTPDQVDAARKKMILALARPKSGVPIREMINGCPTPDGDSWYANSTLSNRTTFVNDAEVRPHLLGCEAEGALSASSPVRVNQIAGTGVYAKNVATSLNDISLVTGADDFSYMFLDYGDPDVTLRKNERMFDLGVEWLAYRPGTRNVVQFTDFEWDVENTPFFSEDFLVPWDPIQSMTAFDPTTKTHGEHDLRVDAFTLTDSLGRTTKEAALYCREFRSLYRGHRRTEPGAPTLLGHGAVCVNTSDAARPILAKYLTQSYAHVIVFPDHSIADATSDIDVTSKPFVAGTTTVGAGSAIFLVGP